MKPTQLPYLSPSTGQRRLDALGVGICCLDFEGRFIDVNPRFCTLLGYKAEELLQLSCWDITHPEDVEDDIKDSQPFIDGQLAIYEREKRYIAKDGSVFWGQLSASVVHDDQANPEYIICAMSDICKRKEMEQSLRESETRFRTLFEQAPFSVQLLTLDGYTRKVNAAWIDLWQAPEDTVKNYVLKEYNVFTDPQIKELGLTPYLTAGFSGKSVVTEPVYYDPAKIGQIGRARWIRAYVHPITDTNGKMREVMFIHHDVTDQMEAKSKLLMAKEAAESANRLKSTFLANMSHEIRTPLGAVLGFTQLLNDDGLSSEDRREYINIIERSGHALTQIIDDILDISRVEAGVMKIDVRRVDIRKSVHAVLDLLRVEATKKNLTLNARVDHDVPEWIDSDPVRLAQILTNLIGNALKFTQQGGVVVKVQTRRSSNFISVAVCDTGIGIATDERSILFKPFCQIDSSATRRYGGTGLGLALSRRLAEALGGDVYLEDSDLERGSTFTLLHPISALADSNTAMAPQLSQPLKSFHPCLQGLKVLVVDDSPDNRRLIEHMLQKEGMMVESVEDGHQAVAKTLDNNYGIILMDIQMPGLNGFDATRRLRQQGYNKPIIALTAYAMKEDLEKCLESGCNDHLSKPINFKKLLECILMQTSQQAAQS